MSYKDCYYTEKPYDKKCSCVHAETLPVGESVEVKTKGINGPLVAKLPVVLGEVEVQIDVEADVDFPKPFFEIKRVKKDIFLTQARLIPCVGGQVNDSTGCYGKIFLEGCVRKNYEFCSCEDHDHKPSKNEDCDEDYKQEDRCEKKEHCHHEKGICISGDISHQTCDIPFRCVAVVKYVVPPMISYREASKQLDYYFSSDKGCHEFKGKTPCENDFLEVIKYIEKPDIELDSAKICDADVFYHQFEGPCGVDCFCGLTEKMVLYLKLKVTQLQPVNIYTGKKDC